MAYEASIRNKSDNAYDTMDFTVADGTGIEKGTLLKITDPRTAIVSSASGDKLAGIAAREKVASDGRTQLSVYRKGVFDMYASGAIGVGESVMSIGADNHVRVASNVASGAMILGKALETATAGAQVQIAVNL